MSSDDFYAIRLHPLGGFAAVSAPASNDRWPVIRPTDTRFDTFEDAKDHGGTMYSEYGINVHPECYVDRTTNVQRDMWAMEDENTLYQDLIRCMHYDLIDQFQWNFAFNRDEFPDHLATLLEETVGDRLFEKPKWGQRG